MTGTPPYVELHAHSAFSFLDGASTPAELADAAAALGYPALALTDHDGIWGSMEFAGCAKGLDLRPITGAELTVRVDGPKSARYRAFFGPSTRAPDAAGRGCTVGTATSAGSDRGARPYPRQHGAGRRTGLGDAGGSRAARRGARLPVGLRPGGGARRGLRAGRHRPRRAARPAPPRRLRPRPLPGRAAAALLAPRPGPQPLARLLAERLGVATVATGNVHSHAAPRSHLQDAFVAVGLDETLEESEPRRRGNSTSALASPAAMAARFAEHPEAVAETAPPGRAAALRPHRRARLQLPRLGGPDADRKLARALRRPAGRALRRRRRNGARPKSGSNRSWRRSARLGLSGFFLLHRDLLELAREVALEVRGPRLRPRGAAARPRPRLERQLDRLLPDRPLPRRPGRRPNLFAGRFLNEELVTGGALDARHRPRLPPRHPRGADPPRPRASTAPSTRRWSPPSRPTARAASCATSARRSGCRRRRSSGWRGWSASTSESGEIERDVVAAIGRGARRRGAGGRCSSSATEAMGLPRHASQHSGGMVISTTAADRRLPGGAGGDGGPPDRPVGQGLLRRRRLPEDRPARAGDALGGRALRRRRSSGGGGERLDLSRIPLDDRETFESIRAAETTGVFQIESRAQMQMLPRTQPRNLDDLTVQVALVRPGPIQGGAVHPYIERRKRAARGPRNYEIPYEHPSLEPVLKETLGTIVYQEQVIEVAMALAGFSSAEAEGLRRAMSRKRSEEAIERHHERFIDGARGRTGVPTATAERVWEQIQGFSGFGFPKAHSAAFGLLAYQSAWLRVHYGPEFLCALLNEQPMGFYPPDALVHEAQRRGVRVGGARRQPQPRPLPRRSGAQRSGPGGADRARLREGGAGGGDGGAGRRARARRALPRDRRPGLALGGRPRRPGAAGLGRGAGRSPARRRGRAAARRFWRVGRRRHGRETAERDAARRCRSSRPRRRALEPLGELGADDRRLPLDRDRTSASTRWRCCARGLGRRGRRAAPTWSRSTTAATVEVAAWSSPASAPRPRRGSSSCCSRTSAARST